MEKVIDRFEHLFRLRLESWTPLKSGLHDYFPQHEIDCLDRAERTFQISRRKIIFLSFENRLVELGGLAAVTRHLPQALVEAGEQVIMLSPLHSTERARAALENGELEECFPLTDFHLCAYSGKIRCYKDLKQKIPTYYLNIEKQFTAGENPYGYFEPEFLLLDSLVFSAGVPFALNKLGITKDIILHANDWETAPVAVTSKYAVISGLLEQARTILTLHNSFDSEIRKRRKQMFFGREIPGGTVLQCSIPLLNGPLTTGSSAFAYELRNDPIQRGVFVNHLQACFSRNPPLGIENGIFGNNSGPFKEIVLKNKKQKAFKDLISEKAKYRKQLLGELINSDDTRIIGRFKFPKDDSSIPVFVMLGRLDLTQKGFDVIFHAFERLPRGSAKLLFCPSSNNSPENLVFFREMEKRCSGDIVILPFRITDAQYTLFLRGASFLVMPSFYEPFGSATEAFLNGTPVLARATGGLFTQINPLNDMKIPPAYKSIIHFDRSLFPPNGILFREEAENENQEKQWGDLSGLTPEMRISNPVYSAMVKSAHDALGIAIDTYSDSHKYVSLVFNGLKQVDGFSWKTAAGKYKKVYDAVSSRGA